MNVDDSDLDDETRSWSVHHELAKLSKETSKLRRRVEDAVALEDALADLATCVGCRTDDVFEAVKFSIYQGEVTATELRARIVELEDELDTRAGSRAFLRLKLRTAYSAVLLGLSVGVLGVVKLGLMLF